jgi:hypothetical protein
MTPPAFWLHPLPDTTGGNFDAIENTGRDLALSLHDNILSGMDMPLHSLNGLGCIGQSGIKNLLGFTATQRFHFDQNRPAI